ncbi:MAG: metallophosphoesterase family protein [Dehalococcoidia bacterium]
MRIGLIADTHIPEAGDALPKEVFQALRRVDLVLHAGDMHVVQVLDWLEGLAPVLAARGNGDTPQGPLRPGVPEDPRVKPVHILEVEGVSLGLIHSFPLPEEVPWANWEALVARLLGHRVDVVVCGDTHVAGVFRRNGLLIVNPGSPTLPNNLVGRLGTVGVLEVARGQVRAEILPLG